MTYKTLCLDGGGFRGVITARILKEIEELLNEEGKTLKDYFDLVSGTSTGSIIASGIVLGKTANEILNLYKENGDKIFPDHIRIKRKIFPWFQRLCSILLYPVDGLQEALAKEFGSLRINEIIKPVLLVPAYDIDLRKTHWFCSNNPKANPQWYDEFEVYKICLYSSAAPTFFPPYSIIKNENEVLLIDGGVSVNNPSLIAVSHAMLLPYKDKDCKIELNDISVLSIGAGQPNRSFKYRDIKKWGYIEWAKRLNDIFIPVPNLITDSVLWQIFTNNQNDNAHRYLRLNPNISDKADEDIDDPNLYQRFVDIAKEYIEEEKIPITLTMQRSVKESIKEFISKNP
jgi:uncharacterized protein